MVASDAEDGPVSVAMSADHGILSATQVRCRINVEHRHTCPYLEGRIIECEYGVINCDLYRFVYLFVATHNFALTFVTHCVVFFA